MRLLIGGIAFIAFFAVTQMFHIHKLSREAAANQLTINTLLIGIESRDQVVKHLRQELEDSEQQGRELRDSLSVAGQQSRDREVGIQRLLNENKVLHDWFARALPDDVIRLQQRPAFATPRDYLRWLSRRQQLPDPGKPAKN